MSKVLRCAKDDAPSMQEAALLLRACRDLIDELVVRLPLYCGMRIGEIQHLRRTWLDWDRGMIELPARQLCQCYECRTWRDGIWSPKTSAGVRTLLIAEEMKSALREFFAENEAVDRSRQGLEWRFCRIWDRSGLKRPSYPHALRATYATRLAEEGMSAPSLCYLLGWESLDSADSYIQSSMKRAHQELGVLLGR